jgi:hypothetical protein
VKVVFASVAGREGWGEIPSECQAGGGALQLASIAGTKGG